MHTAQRLYAFFCAMGVVTTTGLAAGGFDFSSLGMWKFVVLFWFGWSIQAIATAAMVKR